MSDEITKVPDCENLNSEICFRHSPRTMGAVCLRCGHAEVCHLRMQIMGREIPARCVNLPKPMIALANIDLDGKPDIEIASKSLMPVQSRSDFTRGVETMLKMGVSGVEALKVNEVIERVKESLEDLRREKPDEIKLPPSEGESLREIEREKLVESAMASPYRPQGFTREHVENSIGNWESWIVRQQTNRFYREPSATVESFDAFRQRVEVFEAAKWDDLEGYQLKRILMRPDRWRAMMDAFTLKTVDPLDTGAIKNECPLGAVSIPSAELMIPVIADESLAHFTTGGRAIICVLLYQCETLRVGLVTRIVRAQFRALTE